MTPDEEKEFWAGFRKFRLNQMLYGTEPVYLGHWKFGEFEVTTVYVPAIKRQEPERCLITNETFAAGTYTDPYFNSSASDYEDYRNSSNHYPESLSEAQALHESEVLRFKKLILERRTGKNVDQWTSEHDLILKLACSIQPGSGWKGMDNNEQECGIRHNEER